MRLAKKRCELKLDVASREAFTHAKEEAKHQ